MALTRPRAYQIYDIDYKQATRVVTVGNITLSGGAPNQVDGVTLSLNDRILVTGQSTKSQNGIYYVTTLGSGSNGTWARSEDTNTTGELLSGTIVMVTEGNVYADTQWKLTTNDPITIGVSELVFVQNYLANVISSGNSNVEVNANSTIDFTVAGVADVMVVSATGVAVTGTASATGNITGSYIIGNGSQLTGLPASYSNTNVTTLLAAFGSNTISTTGTITSGNITGANILTGGLISATGNVTGGNILTVGTASVTGTITTAAGTNSTGFAVGNGAVSNVGLGFFPTAGTRGDYAIRDYSSVFATMYLDVGMGGSAGGEFQFRSSNAFGLVMRANSSGVYTPGIMSATGIVYGSELNSTNSQTNEGGQINLALPSSGSTLSTSVIVDVFQNRLRFYEGGGTNRGAYIDLTQANASVGTNLLSGGGGGTPGGSNTNVQFNDGGLFGGNGQFVYNKVTNIVTAGAFAGNTNGTGQNFQVGDDAWIGDINTADTIGLKGQQNAANGYIVFGNSDATGKLGRAGTGPLTYAGSFSITGTTTAASVVGGVITGSSTSVTGTTTAASVVGGVMTGSSVSVSGTVTGASHVGSVVSVTGAVTGASVVGGVITGSSTSVTGTTTAASVVGGVITGSSTSVTGTTTAASVVGGVMTGTSLSTTGNITGGNITTAGTATIGGFTISGNTIVSSGSTLTIDPNASGGVDGLVIITGNLQVTGNTTTINSNTVSTNDLTFNFANNAVNSAAANGAGIEAGPIGSPYLTFLYNSTSNVWTSSGGLSAVGTVTSASTVGGVITGSSASVTGAVTAASTVGGVMTGSSLSVTGTINGTTLTGTSLTVSTGNITGGNLILSGAIEDSGQLDLRTTASNGNIVLTPNGTGNVNTGANISVTGRVTAASTVGGVITGSSVSVTGAQTAASTVGGVITGSSVSVTGAQSAASTVGGVITGSSASVSGAVTAASTVGGVITGSSASVTGAVTGASLVGTITTASQTNITGLGNVTTGTWSATAVGLAYGGTGKTTAPAAMAALMGYTSTVTAAGTTTLTNTSSYYQQFTGTSTQTVVLPVTSTLTTGWTFHIVNNSTGNVAVQSSGLNAVITVLPGTTAMVTCIGTALTTAADWEFGYTDFSTATGTGAVVLATSPSLTTPALGAATGTSVSVTGAVTGASVVGGVMTGTSVSVTGAVTAASTVGGVITGSSLSVTGTVTGTAHNGTSVSVSGAVTGASVVGGVMTGTSVSVTGAVTSASVVGGVMSGSSLTVTTGTITGGNIVNGNANGVGNIGSSTTYFNTVFAKATSAQYADLAEMYCADSDYTPGTVLEFGGTEEVTITTTTHSTRVAGIVSTNPSYLMNATLTCKGAIEIALVGRVPCHVVGTIHKGDRLVSSNIPGVATALNIDNYQPGCIVGKSLEDYDSEEVGIIEVAVGRV